MVHEHSRYHGQTDACGSITSDGPEQLVVLAHGLDLHAQRIREGLTLRPPARITEAEKLALTSITHAK